MAEHNRNIPELPAPAGSLELYCILNANELRRFRDKADQAFADCIYKNIATSEENLDG
jgi:hypothetical protein